MFNNLERKGGQKKRREEGLRGKPRLFFNCTCNLRILAPLRGQTSCGGSSYKCWFLASLNANPTSWPHLLLCDLVILFYFSVS